jgi:ATP-binding cassette subfamily C protein
MATYNVQLTVVAIIISLVLVSITTIGNYRQLAFQRNESAQRGRITSLVLQLITGVAKVRVCAAENHAFRVWAQQFSVSKRTGFSIGQVQNVVGTFTSGFGVMSSLAIFATLYYIQTSVVGAPPAFTTGTFIAFNGAFGAFVTALQGLSDASLSLLKAVPTFERLKPILDTQPESDETKISPGKLRGEITVSHLHFRYTPDMPWVIKDISFTIKPGEMVAFVGASGCGKSTLLRLLLGFEKPQSGSITYDGQDLAALDIRAVRQQLGVVLQESRVLPTDIFRNIVGATAHTMDDAWEAARMAGFADDIKDMPMGMHTIVSEGGGTFSGGQRQRLLIARSLVNRPTMIFFDEATSALDNRTQAMVTESLDSLKSTRIVIAHRLSTVVNADRIFYFEGGQIREQGTYQQLMAERGAFAALAKRQIA